MKKVNSHSPLLIIVFILLIIYAISLIFPMLWALMSSFKDAWDFDDFPAKLPAVWHFDNYATAMDFFRVKINPLSGSREVLMPEMYLNSILYCFGSAFLTTFIPCITAYIVQKFGRQFRVLNVYTSIVVVCMSIPIVGSLPSELQIANNLGITNHIWGLWIMKCYFLGMYYLVFFGVFRGIPDSFAEAAEIDGASNLQIMLRIMMPLVKLTFTTVMLIKFIEFWNDYQTPLLFMPYKPTISLGLYKFSFDTNTDISTAPKQLTGCMLVFIPILLVYVIFQRKLVGNISMGGVKE